MPRLKVYRTPIGFHDAYVAAPSQKAALKAWGSDADLFARGVADVVSDEGLAAEPLAHPGIVVKRRRGTAAEQLAALPPDREKPKGVTRATMRKAQPAPPRPSRAPVEAAERALVEAEARQHEAEQALAAEERALADRRRTLRTAQAAETKRLESARDAAETDYTAAMAAWRSAG